MMMNVLDAEIYAADGGDVAAAAARDRSAAQ